VVGVGFGAFGCVDFAVADGVGVGVAAGADEADSIGLRDLGDEDAGASTPLPALFEGDPTEQPIKVNAISAHPVTVPTRDRLLHRTAHTPAVSVLVPLCGRTRYTAKSTVSGPERLDDHRLTYV
jgi:hypothetical protein